MISRASRILCLEVRTTGRLYFKLKINKTGYLLVFISYFLLICDRKPVLSTPFLASELRQHTHMHIQLHTHLITSTKTNHWLLSKFLCIMSN